MCKKISRKVAETQQENEYLPHSVGKALNWLGVDHSPRDLTPDCDPAGAKSRQVGSTQKNFATMRLCERIKPFLIPAMPG